MPRSRLTVSELATEIAVGGWPSIRMRPVKNALLAMRAYLDEIRRVDIVRVDGVRRDPKRVSRLFASLARNVGTTVSMATLGEDAGGATGR